MAMYKVEINEDTAESITKAVLKQIKKTPLTEVSWKLAMLYLPTLTPWL